MVNGGLRSAFPEHVYLTLAWAHLNRNRRTLTTYLAGHPPILHLAAATGRARVIETPGDVLGIYDTIEIAAVQCPVAPGDRVLLFTDGLIELVGPGGMPSRSRGLADLCAAAEARMAQPLEAMVQGIAEDLVQGAEPATDDLLILGVEV